MFASPLHSRSAHPSGSSCTCSSLDSPLHATRRAVHGLSLRQHSACRSPPRRHQTCCAAEQSESETAANRPDVDVSVSSIDLNKEVSKFVTKSATTFAPRASGKQNPAYKGSVLYSVFEWQAYLSVVVGGLLSFNIIFPSDKPDIARLLGMWSLWIFTVPSLRARDCTKPEKDALNLLFLGIPLLNVTLPLVWKSFPFIFSADVAALAAIYAWKVWLPAGEEEA